VDRCRKANGLFAHHGSCHDHRQHAFEIHSTNYGIAPIDGMNWNEPKQICTNGGKRPPIQF
jgi:hypothetical protein